MSTHGAGCGAARRYSFHVPMLVPAGHAGWPTGITALDVATDMHMGSNVSLRHLILPHQPTHHPPAGPTQSEGGRNTLYVQFPSLPILFQAVSQIIVFSSPYNSFANLTIDGRITAKVRAGMQHKSMPLVKTRAAA